MRPRLPKREKAALSQQAAPGLARERREAALDRAARALRRARAPP